MLAWAPSRDRPLWLGWRLTEPGGTADSLHLRGNDCLSPAAFLLPRLQVLKQLADAAKELQEEVRAAAEDEEEEGEEEAVAGAAAGSDADSDAGFGMFQADAFSKGQLAVATRVHGLLTAVLDLAKTVVKLLLAERQVCGLAAGWLSCVLQGG